MIRTESPVERSMRVHAAMWRAHRLPDGATRHSVTTQPVAPAQWAHRQAPRARRHATGPKALPSGRGDDPAPAGPTAALEVDVVALIGRVQAQAVAARHSRLAATNSADADGYTCARSVSPAEALLALQDLERVLAWAEAARAELVVAVAGLEAEALPEARRLTGRSVEDVGASELAAVLGLSSNSATCLVHDARALCQWLPTVHGLMAAGDVGRVKARIITAGAHELDVLIDISGQSETHGQTMARFDAMVARVAARQSPARLRRTVRLAVNRLASAGAHERHVAAAAGRGVTLFEGGNGMSQLQAWLPSLDAARVWQVLEHHAKTQGHGTDDASHMARMADALVSIIDGSSELPPQRRNEVAQVQVVVGLGTLLGASQDAGELTGGRGWLTAEAVRELAQGSALRRLIVDDIDGSLLHHGRTTYRPPLALADHITSRDVTCRAPGCSRPARHCDIDHIVPWEEGGHTDVGNLASLCRRHHLLKTFGKWSYELSPDGSTIWSLPNGLTAADPPTPVITVFEDDPPF